MKCPVCKSHEKSVDIDLHSEGFAEEIWTCSICGAVWAVTHGMTEIVRDPQKKSFLEATSESVEADDYSYAA